MQATEPPIEKFNIKHVPKSDHKSETETELERIEAKLRTVQLSLEVLTGVCATLPDPDLSLGDDEGEDEDDDSGAI